MFTFSFILSQLPSPTLREGEREGDEEGEGRGREREREREREIAVVRGLKARGYQLREKSWDLKTAGV